jgi:hypothetical protein
MPATPPVPNVIRCKLGWHVGEDLTVSNSLDFLYTGGPPSPTDCVALATAARTAMATDLLALLPIAASSTFVSMEDLSSTSGSFGELAGVEAGTRAGATLTASACVLSNYTISRRYRGGKPRSYWPFGTSTDLADASTWSAASQTAFTTAIQAWLNAVRVLASGTTTLTQHVNVSYYQGFTAVVNPITGRTKDVAKLRTGGPVVDIITGMTVNLKPGVQRRRFQR